MKDRDKQDEINQKAEPRSKAEPRPSLAPLEFEEALDALLAVKPEGQAEAETNEG